MDQAAVKLARSILEADFARLGEHVAQAEHAAGTAMFGESERVAAMSHLRANIK